MAMHSNQSTKMANDDQIKLTITAMDRQFQCEFWKYNKTFLMQGEVTWLLINFFQMNNYMYIVNHSGVIASKRGRLITGSVAGSLRLWSTAGVGELRIPGSQSGTPQAGLTMEDEMMLDGAVVASAFDDTMDMVLFKYITS